MAWWREARFGMFIHWGIYSALGGEWNGMDSGKEMGGGSAEHIYFRSLIPREEDKGLAARFNPAKFNAAEWVRIAKDAGMKYMVITSKHHDGFSMFGTKMTPYNIVDATPFHRDVVGELAAECKKQGIRFDVYYSHSLDWENRKRAWLPADPKRSALKVRQEGGAVTVQVPSQPPGAYVNVIALELDGPLQTDPAAKGTYVWVKGIDIRLNTEKMERQRKTGWDDTWSWDKVEQ